MIRCQRFSPSIPEISRQEATNLLSFVLSDIEGGLSSSLSKETEIILRIRFFWCLGAHTPFQKAFTSYVRANVSKVLFPQVLASDELP